MGESLFPDPPLNTNGDGTPESSRLNIEPGSQPSYPLEKMNGRQSEPDPEPPDPPSDGGPTRAELADQVATLTGRLSQAERERDQHEAHAAELAERVQVMRVRLRQHGDDPDVLNGPLPDGLLPPIEEDEPADGHPLTDEEPLDGCEALPAAVFEGLPAVLRETTAMWSREHKRDVFLTSALGILSGCLPSVEGYWGADVPGAVRPNLYTVFVAGAAGGKSAGNYARKLAAEVHRKIRTHAQKELDDWKQRKQAADEEGAPFDEPRPPERGLWVPANTSASNLLDTLSKQDGRGVIFSSEIDTLANALGQDWGKFDSFLRKAYHHESDAQGRRQDGTLWVHDPSVSLVLGGTVKQFCTLIGSAENGLYSRFCLYYFEAADPYQLQKPTAAGIERAERFEKLADRVADLWSTLKRRTTPLRFELLGRHWRQLREHFAPLHREVQERGYSHLVSIPRRAGLWTFRIAMLLTVLRAHDEGAGLARLDTVEARDADVEAALHIARSYADHALRFARAKLADGQPQSPRDRRIAAMLATVDDQFSSGEAYAAAKAAGFDVSNRTLRRDLKAAEKRGLVEGLSGKGGWRITDRV